MCVCACFSLGCEIAGAGSAIGVNKKSNIQIPEIDCLECEFL
jgi:hypothetical protein